MPCYHPLKLYRAKAGRNKETGRWPLVSNPRFGLLDQVVEVPCGRCIGCRLERSRQWAVRCMHELKSHDQSAFLTLTYKDPPPGGSLVLKDLQDFFKRLRKAIHPIKVRYMACGEYGEQLGRPHYHVILFGYDFPDKVPFKKTGSGCQTYISLQLEHLWGHGMTNIGDVTFESCAYVARYVTKKVNGDAAEDHYTVIDPETGEIFHRKPEFIVMSRKPGIGAVWVHKYQDDVIAHKGRVLSNGHLVTMPRYYEKRLVRTREDEVLTIKARRVNVSRETKLAKPLEFGPDRMAVKEECQQLRFKKLPRPLEAMQQFGSYDELKKDLKK